MESINLEAEKSILIRDSKHVEEISKAIIWFIIKIKLGWCGALPRISYPGVKSILQLQVYILGDNNIL